MRVVHLAQQGHEIENRLQNTNHVTSHVTNYSFFVEVTIFFNFYRLYNLVHEFWELRAPRGLATRDQVQNTDIRLYVYTYKIYG